MLQFSHFQKLAQISSLCDFHYISEGIPSPLRFWLLLTKSAADTIEHILKSDHVPLERVSFHFR